MRDIQTPPITDYTVSTPTGLRVLSVLGKGFAFLREPFAHDNPNNPSMRLQISNGFDEPYIATDGTWINDLYLWYILVSLVKGGKSVSIERLSIDLFYTRPDLNKRVTRLFANSTPADMMRLCQHGYYDPQDRIVHGKLEG